MLIASPVDLPCHLIIIFHCHVTFVQRDVNNLGCLVLVIDYQLRVVQKVVIVNGRALPHRKSGQRRWS